MDSDKIKLLNKMLGYAIDYMVENQDCCNCIYKETRDCICDSDICWQGIYNNFLFQAKRELKREAQERRTKQWIKKER